MKSSLERVLLFHTLTLNSRRPSNRENTNFSRKVGFLCPSVQVLVRNFVFAYSTQTYGSCLEIHLVFFKLVHPTTAEEKPTKPTRLSCHGCIKIGFSSMY
eukprot:TRINITY_DN5820_c0_g1_i2.p1 TRINITY_DN5820_c0_g1~~TRINITY_DN5820_c0_g1_i2.p1  ORF type:complete len:100 (-),score=7.29 TRINITY_DN5820_c0_g1_i2:158-457(-)